MTGSCEITGIGITHALGVGVDKFWKNLLNGKCSFSNISTSRRGNSRSTVGAELKGFDVGKYFEQGRALERIWPKTVQMAIVASLQAIHDSGLDIRKNSNEIGLIVGTSVGNLSTTFSFRDKWKETGFTPAHTAFYSFHHAIASVISAELDIKGPSFTISQGCSGGMDMLTLGRSIIMAGQCKSILLVGVDDELVPEIYAALEASNSLSDAFNDEPSKALRPFSRNRSGNVLGEGACALVLEEQNFARIRKAHSYAHVVNTEIGGVGGGRRYDARQPEADATPLEKSIQRTLETITTEKDAPKIAICANGSGSILYDPMEAKVLSTLLSHLKPPIFSIKGSVGQHGAPSAAMQVATAALVIHEKTIPGTINCDKPIEELGDLEINIATRQEIFDYVICNSIGLGGFFYSSITLGRSKLEVNHRIKPAWGNMRLKLAGTFMTSSS